MAISHLNRVGSLQNLWENFSKGGFTAILNCLYNLGIIVHAKQDTLERIVKLTLMNVNLPIAIMESALMLFLILAFENSYSITYGLTCLAAMGLW